MSETTQPKNKKDVANNGSAKAKAEKEPRHLQTFATLGADFVGPAPDEALADPFADGWHAATTSVLSHDSSTLLQQRPSLTTGKENANFTVRPILPPAFSTRSFSHIPASTISHSPVQTKLTVGAAHDPYEEEADEVAEQVMRMPAATFSAPAGVDDPGDDGHSIQRAVEEEEIQAKPLAATIRPFVQRALSAHADEDVQRMAEKEDELQTKRVSAADSFEMGHDFEDRVATTRGGGSPLPAEVRTFMEPRFGADFSGVRLHSDSEAAELNRSVSAQAFTLGHDIYLGEGKTDVTSDSGKQLLAHELTHVVQQGGTNQVRRSPAGILQRDAGTAPDTTTTQPTEEEKAAAKAAAQQAEALAEAARARAHTHQTQTQGEANTEREAGKVPSQEVAASIAVGPVDHQAQDDLQTEVFQKTQIAAEEHATKTQATKAATEAATSEAQNVLATTRAATPKGEPETGQPGEGAEDAATGGPSGSSAEGAVAISAAHAAVDLAMSQKGTGPEAPDQDASYLTVVKTVKTVGDEQQTHKPAQSEADAALAAAEQPAAEVTGLAEANQVSQMEKTETPGFDAAGFKAKLMGRITALTPKSAEDADEFKERDAAGVLKGELQTQVTQERGESTTPLQQATTTAPDASSITPKPVTPLPTPEPGQVPGDISAQNAAPKPKTSADFETPLQQSSLALDTEMTQAGLTQEQLAQSNEPQFLAALDTKKQAQTEVQKAPATYRQFEQGQIDGAETAAVNAAQERLQAMHDDRATLLDQVTGQQTDTKTQDETSRSKVAADIQKIYAESKTKVEGILSGLDAKVNAAFDSGAQAAKQAFEDYVDAKMNAYKEERYGGWLGWAQWIADKILGMPGEVNAFYAEGRQLYLDQMNAVIDNVVSIVGTTLAEAKAEVARGKQRIQEYVDRLPEEQKKEGQDAAQNIQGKFDELDQSINDKQGELIETLANKYQENLQAIDARITEMKAANKGLVDAAIAAVGDVIQIVLELKDMLMNILARAAAAIEMIIKDPIGFLGHLIDGIKLGVQNFLANIGTHLQQGLIAWLTGTLGSAGITLPEKFDLPGIFQLVLQVLGLSMDKIRMRVTNLLGFDLFGIIDKVIEIVNVVRTDGLAGLAKYGLAKLLGQEGADALLKVVDNAQAILSGNFTVLWELFKEHLGDLKAMVIDQIKTFVIEKVITAGITWVISLLNPAGAFVRACKAIYDIIMFFVTRGQQIMALINAVIDSIVAIAQGNIGGAAKMVEDALAKAIPVTIGFLASLLGLGDIGAKVQEIIKKIQGMVDKALDAIFNSKPVQMVANFIKKIINKIKNGIESLKQKLGFGPKGDIGKTVTFTSGKESHKLWVEVKGTQATLMMASKPMSVQDKLVDWEARLTDLSEEKRPEAKGLIDQARAKLAKADQEGDKLAQEQTAEDEAAAEKFEEEDKALESDEDVLAQILTSLLNIFVDEGADRITDWLGRQVVNRSKTGDDTLVDPSRQPTGYKYSPLQRHKQEGGSSIYLIIDHGDSAPRDAQHPDVRINDTGVLEKGVAKPLSPEDDEKIGVYQQVLQAAHIGTDQWPPIGKVSDYRRQMRALVVEHYQGNLEGLDKEIISARVCPSKYNKVISEIFEEWCQANQGIIRRPAPKFVPASNNELIHKRTADGQIEGNILVEVKAISDGSAPRTEQVAQMQDYATIIRGQIPWINGTERKTFKSIRYIFNNQTVANAWHEALEESLSGIYESEPPYTSEGGLEKLTEIEKSHLVDGAISQESAKQVADQTKQESKTIQSITVIDGGDTWDYDVIQRSTKKTSKKEKKDLDIARTAFNKKGFTVEELAATIKQKSEAAQQELQLWIKQGLVEHVEQCSPPKYLFKVEGFGPYDILLDELKERKFLDEICEGVWNNARRSYTTGKFSAEGMEKLVKFRKTEVGPDFDFVDKVVRATTKYAEREFKAIKKRIEERFTAEGIPAVEISLQAPRPVSFGSSGSGTLTSDIDYNIKGDATEKAVEIFNQNFRDKYHRESGTYFDVNAYARDFVPDKGGLVDELTGVEGDVVYEDSSLNAYTAMLMQMKKEEWEKYKTSVTKGLNPDLQNKLKGMFIKAEQRFGQRIKELAEELKMDLGPAEDVGQLKEDFEKAVQALKDKAQASGSQESNAGDQMLQAENNIYQRKLKEVEKVRSKLIELTQTEADARKQLDELKAESSGQPDNNDKAQDLKALIEKMATTIKNAKIELRQKLNEAVLFANEAYVTKGAVTKVVVEGQMKAGKDGKAPPPQPNSPSENLDAFNDSYASLLHHLNVLQEGKEPVMVKPEKYVDRMQEVAPSAEFKKIKTAAARLADAYNRGQAVDAGQVQALRSKVLAWGTKATKNYYASQNSSSGG